MMEHCNNYVCKLNSGCACRCTECKPVAICKSCGTCPTCGQSAKEKEIVYIPYPQPYPVITYPYPVNGYYCYHCHCWHLGTCPAPYYVPNWTYTSFPSAVGIGIGYNGTN